MSSACARRHDRAARWLYTSGSDLARRARHHDPCRTGEQHRGPRRRRTDAMPKGTSALVTIADSSTSRSAGSTCYRLPHRTRKASCPSGSTCTAMTRRPHRRQPRARPGQRQRDARQLRHQRPRHRGVRATIRTRAIRGLEIRGNAVDHLHLGASDSVVVNGNVNGWSIIGNRSTTTNIGIDAIGFEPTMTGKYRYTDADRARNGLIAHNHVARIQFAGNPAYWERRRVGAIARTASTSTAGRTFRSMPIT